MRGDERVEGPWQLFIGSLRFRGRARSPRGPRFRRQHDLGLGHDGGELAVAAGDVGLQHDGGAAGMQRRADRARGIALGDGGEEIGLALDGGGVCLSVRAPRSPLCVSPQAITALA